MGLLDFLKGILSLFIDNFPAFVKRLFGKIPDQLKKEFSLIIDVVENIKFYVDSPVADFIAAIIPGTADDKLKEWLRKALPKLLEELGYVRDNVFVLSENKDIRSAQLHSIATLLHKDLTGSSFGQSAITTEVVYQNS